MSVVRRVPSKVPGMALPSLVPCDPCPTQQAQAVQLHFPTATVIHTHSPEELGRIPQSPRSQDLTLKVPHLRTPRNSRAPSS